MLVKGAPGMQAPNYKSECPSFLSMIRHCNLINAMAKSKFHSFKWSNVSRYLLQSATSFFLVVVRRLQILWQSHDYKHNARLRLWGHIYDYALMLKSIPMSATNAIPLTKTIPMLVTSPITLPLVMPTDAFLYLWPALSQCLCLTP